MSSSFLLRRSLNASVRSPVAGVRFASTEGAPTGAKSPFKQGPSSVETDAQGSDNRGKTTQKILPITAVALAVGAFTWRFMSGDKSKITEVGNVDRSKTRSKSANEALSSRDSSPAQQ